MDFLFQRHQKEKHSSIIHRHGDNLTSPSLLVIPYLNLQRHSNALRALHRTGGPFIHAQRNDLRKWLRKSKIVLDSHWPSCFYTNCLSKYVTREMSLSQTVCFFWKDTFAVRSHILVCDYLLDVQSIYNCVWARKHWQEAYTHTHSLLAGIQGIQCPLPAAIRPSTSRQHVLTVIHSGSAVLCGFDCNEILRKSEFDFSYSSCGFGQGRFCSSRVH